MVGPRPSSGWGAKAAGKLSKVRGTDVAHHELAGVTAGTAGEGRALPGFRDLHS